MNNSAHIISNDVEEKLLQTLVPVNSLTSDHLESLMRDQSIEAVCEGSCLTSVGDYDSKNIYLLSGTVKVSDAMGRATTITADDPECRYPLEDFQPRRHTIVAETDCSIIRFDSDALDAMLAWDQVSHYIMLDIASQRDLDEDAEWMLTLLKSNLFYKVPPMNIRQILNRFEASYFSSGDTVLRQGELGDCCYFIKEGQADVYKSEGEKEYPEKVAELGVGRCFGEDALVNQEVRNATIKMQTNGVLMRLDKQDFFLLLKTPTAGSFSFNEARGENTETTCWIDVRTQDEFEKGHYQSAINMPLNILKLKSRMLDKNKRYIVYCNSGRRSEAAAHLLGEEGFSISAVAGGISALSAKDQLLFNEHLPLIGH